MYHYINTLSYLLCRSQLDRDISKSTGPESCFIMWCVPWTKRRQTIRLHTVICFDQREKVLVKNCVWPCDAPLDREGWKLGKLYRLSNCYLKYEYTKPTDVLYYQLKNPTYARNRYLVKDDLHKNNGRKKNPIYFVEFYVIYRYKNYVCSNVCF